VNGTLSRFRLSAIGAALFLAFAIANVPDSRADQTDSRLPVLFAALSATDDANLGGEIAAEIWEIWLSHNDPGIAHLMSAGISAMQDGKLRAAFDAFDRIVAAAPDFAEGWNKRATVNYMLDDLDASMRDIERTLSLEPRHFGALSGMGLIFDAIGKPGAAADAWERALAVNPHIKGAGDLIKELREKELGKPI